MTINIKETSNNTTRSLLVTAPHHQTEDKELLISMEQEQIIIQPSIVNKYGEVESCFNIKFDLLQFETFLAKINKLLEQHKNDRIAIPNGLE